VPRDASRCRVFFVGRFDVGEVEFDLGGADTFLSGINGNRGIESGELGREVV